MASGIKALLFEHIAHFTAFVRVYGARADSRRGYTLYRLPHPEGVGGIGRQVLLLTGFHPRSAAGREPVPFRRIEVRTDAEGVGGLRPDPDETLPILSQRTGRSLLELVALRAWGGEPAGARDPLVFRLDGPAWFADLVAGNFALGNDRVQFAQFAAADGSSDPSLHVRVVNPSHYWIEIAHERSDVEVYYQVGDRLFLPWGMEHPLQRLWQAPDEEAEDGSLFFAPDGQPRRLAGGTWTDIYEAIQFDIDLAGETLEALPDAEAFRLRIPLRLEPRTHPAEAELWMLDESDRPRLETLLGQVDRDDLGNLLFSAQEDESGRHRLFLREKKSTGGLHFDFGGRAFACYKGFHNLLLPVRMELQPQLRRDQYRQLFGLSNDLLTLVVPDGEGGWRHVRIKDGAFVPLSRYVDYLVTAESETLRDLMGRTVFDYGRYAKSPRRPDLRPEAKRRESRIGESAANEPDPSAPLTADEASQQQREQRRPGERREADDPDALARLPASEQDRREHALERAVSERMDQWQPWLDLADMKAARSKAADEIDCLVHAAWLTPPRTPDEAGLLRRWSDLLANELGSEDPAYLDELLRRDAKPLSATLMALLLGTQDWSADENRWLQAASAHLRGIEGGLTLKRRWLLWQCLLRKTRDAVEQARLRETMLEEISAHGVALDNLPAFLRPHIAASGDEEADDAADGRSNLIAIGRRVGAMPPEAKPPFRAMLAWAWARQGDFATARTKIEELRGGWVDTRRGEVVRRLASDREQRTVNLAMSTIWTCAFMAVAMSETDELEATRCQSTVAAIQAALPARERPVVERLLETVAQRGEVENPAELLCSENDRVYFPTSADDDRDAELDQAAEAYARGELDDRQFAEIAFERVEAWPENLDGRAFAMRLRQLHRTALARLQWGGQRLEVLRRYRALLGRLPARGGSDFYYVLAMNTAAQSLLHLGQEGEARGLLDQVLQTDARGPVDQLDIWSDALTVVEGFPLGERMAMIRRITPRIDAASSLFVSQLRLLDQLVEASASKERLALSKYQRALDFEEYNIRRRLLREDACAPAQTAPQTEESP